MPHGLTSSQAADLLKQYGPNTIQDSQKASSLSKFIEQFKSFLILLLLFAGVLSIIIGEYVDGSLILAIILVDAIFGFYQEQKAEEAVAMLRTMAISNTRVLRNGQQIEVDSRELVPGDIIFIEEGNKISADAKIIEVHNVEINESSLTGESVPVVKAVGDELFMGTIVARGRAVAEIVQTGMKTKFGLIAGSLLGLKEGKTPLQKKLEYLSEVIGLVGIVISLIVFGLGIIHGNNYFSSFLLAISLAVAIVPEGLPAVMTITLAVGVKKMAEKKAIIRKMSAIEALGSTTLIATDKTGTLTTNKMQVKEIWIDNAAYSLENAPDVHNPIFAKLLENGILCSTASLVAVHDHGNYDVLGDPTEGALLLMATKLGLNIDLVKKETQLLDEFSFDSVTKRMSVIVKRNSTVTDFTKGAPESILSICSEICRGDKVVTLTDEEREKIQSIITEWTSKGLRVLGFSYKNSRSERALTQEERESYQQTMQDHVFLGMVAIHDPPRPEVREALEKCSRAGIKVVMITGDNEKTAESIGTSIGLVQRGDLIIKGEQVEEYSDEELLSLLPEVRIFARITPFHKSRIVSLYQKLGEIVTVTGDGINDAIALKQADVGVAMGLVGTDVARETADMVITDDNFATIVNAVDEGRNIVKNLQNSIKYLLTGNLTEALSVMLSLLLGLPAILIPIQLLYINLVTDGVPALALAFSPRSKNTMSQKPERAVRLLSAFDMAYIMLVGLVGASLVIGSSLYFGNNVLAVQKTVAFTVLVLLQSFIFIDIWLSHRALHQNIRHLFSRIFILSFFIPFIAQLLILKVPVFAEIFEVQVITLAQFGEYVLAAGLIVVGMESVKFVLRYRE